jgi:hypothetical protein
MRKVGHGRRIVRLGRGDFVGQGVLGGSKDVCMCMLLSHLCPKPQAGRHDDSGRAEDPMGLR